MKRHCALLVISCLLSSAIVARAVVVNLSTQEIEEAIAFGKAHSSSIEKPLDERYSFGPATPYAENGTIHTRWYKLAFLAAVAARRGTAVTQQQQSDILSDPCLQINATIYGHGLDFAKEYQVSLIQKGKELKPDKFHADHFTSHQGTEKPFAGFPCCWAVLRCYFKYDSLDPAGTATLVIKKDGNETRLDIDFKRYK